MRNGAEKGFKKRLGLRLRRVRGRKEAMFADAREMFSFSQLG
jgi:hypothetical protein